MVGKALAGPKLTKEQAHVVYIIKSYTTYVSVIISFLASNFLPNFTLKNVETQM